MGLDIQILYEPKPLKGQKAKWMASEPSKGYIREAYGHGGLADEIHEFAFGCDMYDGRYAELLQGPEGDKAVHVLISDLILRLKQYIPKVIEADGDDFDPYSDEMLCRIKEAVEFVQFAIEDAFRNKREYVRIARWG